jgi:hypothetical protein
MLKIFEFYALLLFTVGYHGNQNIFFSMKGGCIFYISKLKVTVKMLKIKRLM